MALSQACDLNELTCARIIMEDSKLLKPDTLQLPSDTPIDIVYYIAIYYDALSHLMQSLFTLLRSALDPDSLLFDMARDILHEQLPAISAALFGVAKKLPINEIDSLKAYNYVVNPQQEEILSVKMEVTCLIFRFRHECFSLHPPPFL